MRVAQRRRRQIAILVAHRAAEISFRKRRVVVEPVHNRRDGKPSFEAELGMQHRIHVSIPPKPLPQMPIRAGST